MFLEFQFDEYSKQNEQLSLRVLKGGHKSVGTIVVRGKISAAVMDALASVEAVAVDRHRAFEARAEVPKQKESHDPEPNAKSQPINGVDGKRGIPLRYGQIDLDPIKRHVLKGGTLIHLTPKEFDMLHCLMSNAGESIPHKRLLRTVWGPEHAGHSEYLRTFVSLLRKKIEDDPQSPKYLLTDPYFGYRFEPQPDGE